MCSLPNLIPHRNEALTLTPVTAWLLERSYLDNMGAIRASEAWIALFVWFVQGIRNAENSGRLWAVRVIDVGGRICHVYGYGRACEE